MLDGKILENICHALIFKEVWLHLESNNIFELKSLIVSPWFNNQRNIFNIWNANIKKKINSQKTSFYPEPNPLISMANYTPRNYIPAKCGVNDNTWPGGFFGVCNISNTTRLKLKQRAFDFSKL